MEMDENLASVHAYLCADGYVIKNPETQKHKYYMIGFRNTNLTLLKDFQERFEKVFDTKPYLIERQRCRIGSKDIYEKLTKKFGSFYSWKWKMPDLNNDLSKNWLRAYFDCESWITCKSHQNRMIGVDCVNEEGIRQVGDALKRLGINSLLKKRTTRNIFSLKIYGKDNIVKFRDKINFLHPEKKEKLELAIRDFMDYKWIFPEENDELIKFLRKLLNIKAKISISNWIVRIISREEKNLVKLSEELKRLFKIRYKLYKRTNGIGTVYYELDINKKEDITILINNGLLNKAEEEKWLKSRR
mgnify:CR=1 FL=1